MTIDTPDEPPKKKIKAEVPEEQTLLQDEMTYGCSKCRYAARGCNVCNPSKAARYWDKKEKANQ